MKTESVYEYELDLYRIAQRVCDEIMGEGTYVELNGFDPSKGETHATPRP